MAVPVGTGAGIGYSGGMTDPDENPAPREWIEALERSEADLKAGLLVPLEEVLAELDADIRELEARLAARAIAEDEPAGLPRPVP